VDILTDVQENDERALVADLGQALTESGYATGVVTFQVM
jgi:hypothetical protein